MPRDRLLFPAGGLGVLVALVAPQASASCLPPVAAGDAAVVIGDNEAAYLFSPSVTLDGTLYGLYAGDANVIATRDDDGALTAGDTGLCLGDDNRFEGGFRRGFTAGAIAEIGDHTVFTIRLSGETAAVERGLVAGDDATILLVNEGKTPLVVEDGPLIAAGARGDITLRGSYRIESGDAVVAGSDAESGEADAQVTVEGTLVARDGAAIRLGGGEDLVVVDGTIEGADGAVDLGAGDDALVLYTGSAVEGGLEGGAGADRLTLDRRAEGAEAGTLGAATGFETLDVAAGLWTLAEASSFDTIAVEAPATLVAPDGFGGAATVAGRLEAAGSVSSIVIETGGVLAVHGPTGAVLDASGEVTIAGTLEIDLAADGSTDGIVAETIALDTKSARLVLSAAAGSYAARTDYTILTARQTDGLTGRFAEVSEDYALLDAELAYLDEAVVLTLVRNGVAFADLARTRNQRAVGAAVDAGGEWVIAERLVGLTAEAIRDGLDDLSGDLFPSVAGAQIAEANIVRDTIERRFAAAFGGPDGGAVPLAYDEPAPTNGAAFDRLLAADGMRPAGWLSGVGAWLSAEGDGNAGALDGSFGGALGGLDLVSGDTLFGAALGYSDGSLDGTSRGADAQTDTVLLALYGARRFGPLALSGGATYGWTSVDSRRVALGDTYRAAYDGTTANLFAEIAYTAQRDRLALEPFAGLSYARVEEDGFTEQGGPAALVSEGEHFDSVASTLGLRAAYNLSLGGGGRLVPSASIAWRHAYGDRTPEATLRFAETATGFTVAGLPIAGDVLALGAGVAFAFAPDVTVGVDYAGQFGDGVASNALKATGRIAF